MPLYREQDCSLSVLQRRAARKQATERSKMVEAWEDGYHKKRAAQPGSPLRVLSLGTRFRGDDEGKGITDRGSCASSLTGSDASASATRCPLDVFDSASICRMRSRVTENS